MTDTTVTYEREMTMTYGDDGISHAKRAKMNTLLYQDGLCLMGRWTQNTAAEHFGMMEFETTKKHTEIVVEGETYTETDRDVIAGWNRAIAAVQQHYPDLTTTVNEKQEVTIKREEQQPAGCYMVIAGDYADVASDGLGLFNRAKPLGMNIETDGDVILMLVELELQRYSAPELKFVLRWEAPSVQRTAEIQKHLVEGPLAVMGYIQASVERCLEFVGIEAADPMIDCEFKCINESKSECAPDIIEMVRAEKQKHL